VHSVARVAVCNVIVFKDVSVNSAVAAFGRWTSSLTRAAPLCWSGRKKIWAWSPSRCHH